MRADFEAYLQWNSDDSLAELLDAASEAGMDYIVVFPNNVQNRAGDVLQVGRPTTDLETTLHQQVFTGSTHSCNQSIRK